MIESQLLANYDAQKVNTQRASDVEMSWWGGSLIRDPKEAAAQKVLVPVTSDLGYKVDVHLLENGGAFLRPEGLVLLKRIGLRFSNDLRNNHLSTDVSFGVCRLFLPVTDQTLANCGIDLSHSAGAAIDIDPGNLSERYLVTLHHILENLENSGLCQFNPIYEFNIHDGQIVSIDSCYHICVAPQLC